jgi:hypothetical protein
MSIKEGRILESHEEVDHLDGDKTNDRIENLEIVTRKENKRRYANTQTRQMITLTCIQCNATFERERRQVIYKESYLSGHICCSRKCANSLRRSLL